ncbi:MAG: hypothetical protein GWN62_28300 [Aliifodinibius sp.]|nr:hypothetical protein [Fodinibius sp.]
MTKLMLALNKYGSSWYFVTSNDSTAQFYQQVSTPGGTENATGVIAFI